MKKSKKIGLVCSPGGPSVGKRPKVQAQAALLRRSDGSEGEINTAHIKKCKTLVISFDKIVLS